MLDNKERLPQGKAHTRDYALPPRLPRDQEISNSIFDTISNKLLYRRRPIAPDSFETFLRDRKEITLADIYHTLNEKSAASFDGLVWFAVSRQGSFAVLYACCGATDGNEDVSNPAFTSLFPNGNVGDLSVSEAFHQFRAGYEQVSPGTLRLWYTTQPERLTDGGLTFYSCLTKTAPEIKRLFSYFRLFTLSAYSEPQFWARILLAFFLCWSGYASPEFVDIVLQSSGYDCKADNSRGYCLPSRGMSFFLFPLVVLF